MTMVLVWVVAGVLGIAVLVVPALRLWREVRALGRTVKQVSRDIGDAREGLDAVTRNLPRRY